nr:hypothetical protein Iba_chr06eCG8990 [Ipomoea batatas]
MNPLEKRFQICSSWRECDIGVGMDGDQIAPIGVPSAACKPRKYMVPIIPSAAFVEALKLALRIFRRPWIPAQGQYFTEAKPVTPLRDRGERGRTRIGHFLRKNGQDIRKVGLVHRYLQGGPDVVLHRLSPAVKGLSAELVHQVLPDRSSGDCCENGFAGLLTSTNVMGEQDGIGEDLLSQIRALQDPPPGLFGRPKLALELLDPLIPLGEGLFKGRHFSTVDFVPIFSPGEEISDRVSHLHNYRSAAEHVDHRSRRPRPVTTRAFHRCDLLDLGLFFLPALGGPSLVVIAAQAGGVRGGQGQPDRDQCFGAGVSDLNEPREPASGSEGLTATVTAALWGVYFSGRSYLGGSKFAF